MRAAAGDGLFENGRVFRSQTMQISEPCECVVVLLQRAVWPRALDRLSEISANQHFGRCAYWRAEL